MHQQVRSGLIALLACTTLTGDAAADCCGPPPTPPNEVRSGRGWTGSVLYEHMDMSSLLKGSEKVTPDQVLQERLKAGAGSFSVPTEMFMDRATVQISYRFDDHHAIRVSVPWRFNQMDMRMSRKVSATASGGAGMAHHRALAQGMGGDMGMGDMPMGDNAGETGMTTMESGAMDMDNPMDMDMANGQSMGGHSQPMVMTMDHTMDPIEGLGDIALNYSYTFPLDDAQVYLGAGLQLPSGQWAVRDSGSQLVHNMMQPGSGTVALMGEAGADIGLGDSKFSLHPRLGVLWNATNPLGYQRGTRFDYELGARYQIAPEVGVSLDLVGFTQGMDSSNGTIDPASGQVAFQRPETSLVDNVANTGGSFLFLAPGIRLQPTDSLYLGFQYRLPLRQDVNGTQLGIDSWYRAFLSARF